MLNIQTTKLPQVDKIIPFCKVVSLASGSVPKFIIVELPNSDGARINAWWTGSPSNLAVNDYVRIQRQAIDKRYVVIGTDQSTADVVTGGAIPAPGKVKLWDVSASAAVDYDTLSDALAAYENNDIIVLGAGDYDIGSAQIANSNALSIIGQGRTLTTLTSSHATEIFKPTADLTVEGLTINATGGGDAFTVDDTTVIIRDVTYEIAFGPGMFGINMGASAEALVTVEYSRFVIGGGTAIAIANNSSSLYLYGGYFGGATAISHTNTPTIQLHDTPTLVGTVSSLANGIYIDANGNAVLGPDSYVDFEERTSKPTVGTGRWGLYFKSDGAYQVDDAGAETSLAQSGGSGIGQNLLYHSITHDNYQETTSKANVLDDTYVADIWNTLHNAGASTGPTFTRQAGSSTDPFSYYSRWALGENSTKIAIVQFLSAEDTRPLRGKTVSLSADLWATGITAMRMSVIEWAGTADAITSDVVSTWGTANPVLATNWSYCSAPGASITIDGTRNRYPVENITVGTGANNLAVMIWLPGAEVIGDLFNVARVKLEVGATATDFIARPYDDEYRACRAWLRDLGRGGLGGTWISANSAFIYWPFVGGGMYRPPTLTISDTSPDFLEVTTSGTPAVRTGSSTALSGATTTKHLAVATFDGFSGATAGSFASIATTQTTPVAWASSRL